MRTIEIAVMVLAFAGTASCFRQSERASPPTVAAAAPPAPVASAPPRPRRPPELAWLHACEPGTEALHAVTLDTADRRRHGGLLYVETSEGIVQLREDLTERLVPFQPLPPRRGPRDLPRSYHSLSGLHVFTNGPESRHVGGSRAEPAWALPLRSATLHGVLGQLQCEYRDVFDVAFISDDGRTTVTVPGRASSLEGPWQETPFHGAIFLDAEGRRVGRIVDERADFATADLSADGSLFAHVSDGAVVACDRSGARAWTARIEEGCADHAQLLVAPRGHAVAMRLLPDPFQQPRRPPLEMTRVLDASGHWLSLEGRDEVEGWPAAFSRDGGSLLVIDHEGRARVYRLGSGRLAWTHAHAGSPDGVRPFGLSSCAGALDAAGRRVATVSAIQDGSNWTGVSDGLQVMAWDTMTGQLLLLAELRWDELGISAPPRLSCSATLSDDGAWLLVDPGSSPLLFRLP